MGERAPTRKSLRAPSWSDQRHLRERQASQRGGLWWIADDTKIRYARHGSPVNAEFGLVLGAP
jgi:hypothetical protein